MLDILIEESERALGNILGHNVQIAYAKATLNLKQLLKDYIFICMRASDINRGEIGIIIPASIACALLDSMLGESRANQVGQTSLTTEDLWLVKDVMSNVFMHVNERINNSQGAQDLHFECVSVELMHKEVNKNYALAHALDFSIKNTRSQLIYLFSHNLAGLFARDEEGLESLMNMKLNLCVRIGKDKISLKDVLSFEVGDVLSFEQRCDAPFDILLNECVIGQCKGVLVDDRLGIQILNINLEKMRI